MVLDRGAASVGVMTRRTLARVLLALVGLLGGPLLGEAQPAGTPRRIGILRVGEPPGTYMAGFRQGLREAGYVEGQNITFEYGLARTASQLPEMAADLVRRRVEVLVASGTPSVVPARDVSPPVPVVFVAAVDPVAAGVVKSLARPGGHVTGVTAVHADVTGKRLALLKELVPRASRMAFLVRAGSPATAQYVKEAEQAAAVLGVQLQVVSMREAADLDSALAAAQGAGGVLVVDDAVITTHRVQLAQLAVKYHLPTVFGFSEMVAAGGLMAYGPDYGEMYRRAATLVHKILTGARPGEVPVEQPTKFELVISAKTARALRLTIPRSLLMRADQLVE